MTRAPAQAFADLSDALTRMTALNLDMQEDRSGQDVTLITAWDAQADRAMAAHCELIIQGGAMRAIEAMLATAYSPESS